MMTMMMMMAVRMEMAGRSLQRRPDILISMKLKITNG